jgi:hypothetical protein
VSLCVCVCVCVYVLVFVSVSMCLSACVCVCESLPALVRSRVCCFLSSFFSHVASVLPTAKKARVSSVITTLAYPPCPSVRMELV